MIELSRQFCRSEIQRKWGGRRGFIGFHAKENTDINLPGFPVARPSTLEPCLEAAVAVPSILHDATLWGIRLEAGHVVGGGAVVGAGTFDEGAEIIWGRFAPVPAGGENAVRL
jgi:hypothetical protein